MSSCPKSSPSPRREFARFIIFIVLVQQPAITWQCHCMHDRLVTVQLRLTCTATWCNLTEVRCVSTATPLVRLLFSLCHVSSIKDLDPYISQYRATTSHLMASIRSRCTTRTGWRISNYFVPLVPPNTVVSANSHADPVQSKHGHFGSSCGTAWGYHAFVSAS